VSAIPPASGRPRLGLVATLLSTAASYRGAGIHTYSRQLLQHLPGQQPALAYHAFVNDPAYQPPPGIDLHRAPAASQRPLLRILWEQIALPLAARRRQIDLFHGLAYALPLAAGLPGVVTVHDLSFLLFPHSFGPGNRLYLSRITALSCRRARKVIAVSQATARDVQRLLGVPADRIEVIYNGVDEAYFPRPAAEIEETRLRAGWPDRFLLSVGTLEPRKNHLMLIEAYAIYRRLAVAPLPLLIAGGRGWQYDAIFARVSALGLDQHVHFLGFAPASLLPWLYNAATVFVYPSRYEGFGLPVAEALACGLPAITSTASSLPEVAGEAAHTVDPDDTETLAVALAAITGDAERRAMMRAAGLAQAERFRWTLTAAKTAALYASITEDRHG